MFTVKPGRIKYTDISDIPPDYTDKMNKQFNWMANFYGFFIMVFPSWKKWIKKVIPHIEGRTILEVSFGTGYLMSQYASHNYEIYGINYNERMVRIAQEKMYNKGFDIHLLKGKL